jgi:tubulin-specific chaperone A
MAPSQIQIAISALQRLLKEEQSYYKEQEQQEARITRLENEGAGNNDNYEYQMRQEVRTYIFDADYLLI